MAINPNVLQESEKMRRVPGIIFADGPTGRRARIAGTGIEVFELMMSWDDFGHDWDQFRAYHDWLSAAQLHAALRYAELYPEEIEPIVREWRLLNEELESRPPGDSREFRPVKNPIT